MSRPGSWASFALFALFAPLLLVAPVTFADSLLNGLANHKEFNKDQFIGALYTDTLSSDASTLLNNSGRKRMELRVTTKRLSSRRLNSMWIEGMAINNPPNLLSAQAEHMVTFTTFIKRSLRAGDVLEIRGDQSGTTVTLNDVQLGKIESPDFFNMVLRTWIGGVPLSSDFRDALLTGGKVDSELLATFESTSPSQGRRDAIAKWVQPTGELAADTAATSAKSNKPNPGITKPVLAAPSLVAPALIEKPTLAVAEPETAESSITEPSATTKDEPSTTAKPSTTAESEKAAEPAAESIAQAPAETPASTPEPESEPAVAKAVPQPTPSEAALLEEEELFDDEEEDSGPLLTAESLLSRQIYHSELLRWTYKHIRYPKRAATRGQEGSVRVAVVIDRQGKVKSVSEVEASKYSTLNREAMNAVDRAEPFPPIPDAVPGSEFAFSLPIHFKLPD
ncbi:TonB family protein [Pseudomaricurvus sp.]|uniref:TonB family protein n=1 Tax=Pseudomaricurvus sp. TaxID=2004510 RepID=UPI003F6A7A48